MIRNSSGASNLLLVAVLIIGLAYTLAFATLAVGHLNVLTVTFVPMLIGLAIDFGVHLITRYEEELRHGKCQKAALMKAMAYTGQGIFTGALTTAGAFIAMIFTDFRGIREMGIICGGGLLLCFIPMMTMLPVLLLRGRQNVIDLSMKEDLARAVVRVEVAAVVGVAVARRHVPHREGHLVDRILVERNRHRSQSHR